jgi:hypothetical protein
MGHAAGEDGKTGFQNLTIANNVSFGLEEPLSDNATRDKQVSPAFDAA